MRIQVVAECSHEDVAGAWSLFIDTLITGGALQSMIAEGNHVFGPQWVSAMDEDMLRRMNKVIDRYN